MNTITASASLKIISPPNAAPAMIPSITAPAAATGMPGMACARSLYPAYEFASADTLVALAERHRADGTYLFQSHFGQLVLPNGASQSLKGLERYFDLKLFKSANQDEDDGRYLLTVVDRIERDSEKTDLILAASRPIFCLADSIMFANRARRPENRLISSLNQWNGTSQAVEGIFKVQRWNNIDAEMLLADIIDLSGEGARAIPLATFLGLPLLGFSPMTTIIVGGILVIASYVIYSNVPSWGYRPDEDDLYKGNRFQRLVSHIENNAMVAPLKSRWMAVPGPSLQAVIVSQHNEAAGFSELIGKKLGLVEMGLDGI